MKMSKYLLAFAFVFPFLVTQNALCQSITLKDRTTLEPIENVFVTDIGKTKKYLSDKRGQIVSHAFSENDTLEISHTSYGKIIIPFSSVMKADLPRQLKKLKTG